MASKDKKGKKGSNDTNKATKGVGGAITGAATELLGEVEKTGEALVTEVKQLFDDLTHKITEVASATAETTVSVAEKVAKEPAELLRGLVNEVTAAGESSLQVIGDGFDTLKKQLLGSGEAGTPEPSVKKEKKKKTKKDKKVSTEESTARKTTPVAKKTTAKKKPTTKKKATAKKKAIATPADVPITKKAVVRKKTTTKKATVAKKAVARKKAPAKATTPKEP